MSFIIDVNKVNTYSIPYLKLHKVIKNLSLFNPECLGYVYIINPSYGLYLVWKIIESNFI